MVFVGLVADVCQSIGSKRNVITDCPFFMPKNSNLIMMCCDTNVVANRHIFIIFSKTIFPLRLLQKSQYYAMNYRQQVDIIILLFRPLENSCDTTQGPNSPRYYFDRRGEDIAADITTRTEIIRSLQSCCRTHCPHTNYRQQASAMSCCSSREVETLERVSLSKLLLKSRGAPYEEALRRIIKQKLSANLLESRHHFGEVCDSRRGLEGPYLKASAKFTIDSGIRGSGRESDLPKSTVPLLSLSRGAVGSRPQHNSDSRTSAGTGQRCRQRNILRDTSSMQRRNLPNKSEDQVRFDRNPPLTSSQLSTLFRLFLTLSSK